MNRRQLALTLAFLLTGLGSSATAAVRIQPRGGGDGGDNGGGSQPTDRGGDDGGSRPAAPRGGATESLPSSTMGSGGSSRVRIGRRGGGPSFNGVWSAPGRSSGATGRTRITPRSGSSERSGSYGAEGDSNHVRIVPRTGFSNSMERHEHVEITPGHYYWHRMHGDRYVHTYYGGYHWYGFYDGPRFYWARYHDGLWWSFDVAWGRWLYWWNGAWLWPAPDGVVYIYENNNYEQFDPTATRPVDAEPAAPADASGSWTSPDRRRMVQVYGPRSEAFLYDLTSGQPVFLKYLAADVQDIRFANTPGHTGPSILVDFKTGTFALFDENGRPLDDDAAHAATPVPDTPPTRSEVSPPSGDELPPPPTSAP